LFPHTIKRVNINLAFKPVLLMRPALIGLVMFFSWLAVAHAQPRVILAGYQDCDLKHLSACEDSNQLFFYPSKLIGTPARRKHDFTDALKAFLRNAPGFKRGSTVPASDVAATSLTGPEGPPVRLATGELLLEGFVPHDAPASGAVVLTTSGEIQLVATFETPNIDEIFDPNAYGLRIYVRTDSPKPEWIGYVQDWAKDIVLRWGQENSVLETKLFFVTGGQRWQTRSIP
jgi:hypothetical protein